MNDAAAAQEKEMKPLIDEHRRSRGMVIQVLDEVELPLNWRRRILY
jgi:hypothetical protein